MPDLPARLEALGCAIHSLRIEKRLNRAQLAEAAGLSYPYLAEIETGRKNSLSAIFAVADALGMPLSALLAKAEALG